MTNPAGDTVQAFRVRNRFIAALRADLKGAGLDIRERENGLVISHPGHPEYGRIHITYARGEVSLRRTLWDFLGRLDGHPASGPDAEPRVTVDMIRRILTGQASTHS
jgi:hypothetical protein